MDVGIDLHNLRGTGRLGAVARALRVSEFEALGMLTIAWAETQHRELVCVSADDFHDATAIHFDEPAKVLEAMARAKLATHDSQSNTWQIHGNEKHVVKLKAYRANASLGGRALAAKRHAVRHTQNTPNGPKAMPNGTPPGKQAAAKRHASWVPNGMPLGFQTDALDILDTGTRDPDLCVSDSALPLASNLEDLPRSPPAMPAGKRPSVWSELAGEVERAKPLTPAAQIRRAYHEAYAEKFNREFKGWGKRENGQAAQLVGSWSLATVLELIPKFFKWTNPQVMMAGYPFGLGHASFISRIHELDADTHAPDRKRLANAVNANDRQVGNEDAEKIRYETEMRELRKGWAEPKQIGSGP